MANETDVFVSIHEGALNRVAHHIMRQNPSLFNYGTQVVADNPQLLCYPVQGPPPLVSVVSPLEVPPSIPINYCYQLRSVEIDFHPGGLFELPPQFGGDPNQTPPQPGVLPEQRFAIRANVCAGVELRRNQPFTCFCLELFIVMRLRIAQGSTGQQQVVAELHRLEDGREAVEIVDVRPENLETIAEGLVRLMIDEAFLPKLTFDVSSLSFQIGDLANLSLVAVPANQTPDNHNPSIISDQLQLFLKVRV